MLEAQPESPIVIPERWKALSPGPVAKAVGMQRSLSRNGLVMVEGSAAISGSASMEGAMLSSQTLVGLETILSWAIARESRLSSQAKAGLGPGTGPDQPHKLVGHANASQDPRQIPFEPELLKAIRRHRLEITMAPHLETLSWPEPVVGSLRRIARQQRLGALPLLATGIECCRQLQAAGIRCLLFKGPALALQTTGDSSARGTGDIDLLVDPAALPEAVAILEGIGFRRQPGEFPQDLSSLWGRYGRWAGYELSMRRGRLWLDLHWALSNLRSPLPQFEAIWAERQILGVNGNVLVTLSQRHAFLHACVHACKDEWMTLRHVVDIGRLAKQVPATDRPGLRRSKAVQLSCAVAYHCLASSALLDYTNPQTNACRQALKTAQWNQLRQPRARSTLPWQPQHWLAAFGHRLLLAQSIQDWLRTIAYLIVLPAEINDPITGKDRNVVEVVGARCVKGAARWLQWRQAGTAGAARTDSTRAG